MRKVFNNLKSTYSEKKSTFDNEKTKKNKLQEEYMKTIQNYKNRKK